MGGWNSTNAQNKMKKRKEKVKDDDITSAQRREVLISFTSM